MGNKRDYLIKEIVELSHKLDAKGFVANHDGNISVLHDGGILSTPTATAKFDILPQTILTLDMEGKKIQGIGKPFSEIKLHLAAYRSREDINAVIHAHPPFTMARGLVGGDFHIEVPEAIVSIGHLIPVARYAMPGAPENDAIIAEALSLCDVFMMAGNGVLSVGRDLKEAYLRLELLEHLLKIDHYARAMGPVMTIPEADKQKLLDKRAAIGLGPKGGVQGVQAPSPQIADQSELIKSIIADELKKILTK